MRKVHFFITIIIIIILMCIPNLVLSADYTINLDTNVQGKTPTGNTTSALVNRYIGRFSSFLYWTAIIASTIVVAILGVKYMVGSVEERSEYKKSMLPLVFGIAIAMCGSMFANLLYKIFTTK